MASVPFVEIVLPIFGRELIINPRDAGDRFQLRFDVSFLLVTRHFTGDCDYAIVHGGPDTGVANVLSAVCWPSHRLTLIAALWEHRLAKVAVDVLGPFRV